MGRSVSVLRTKLFATFLGYTLADVYDNERAQRTSHLIGANNFFPHLAFEHRGIDVDFADLPVITLHS